MRFPPAPRRRLRARASILAVAVLLGCAGAAAVPAAAGAEVLFNTITGPITASGPNVETVDASFWVAQPFVPDLSGRADVVSFWSQCVGIGCAADVVMEIRANAGGVPGGVLGTAGARVGDTLGGAPTCARVAGTPALTAGATYWAVMRGAGGLATWNFQTNAPKTVLVSSNAGGVWRAGAIQKTFGLKVEQSTGGCGPDILPNPPAGTAVADMIARPGGASFNTIFIANRGNASLTLRGAAFSGPDAATFELLDAQPGPLARPLTFPRQIAANPQAGLIMYVVCRGAGASGLRAATLTLTSDDPDAGSIAWPVRCLIDGTAPTLAFQQAPTGQAGWWITEPAFLTARGLDPESNNFVKRIACTDTLGPTREVFGSIMNLQPYSGDGVHVLSCTATDVADNVSVAFRVEVRIDTRPPEPAFDAAPAVTNDATPEVAFHATDATSGVGRFECRVDGAGAPAPCTSPATLPAQADGAHRLELRAVDVAGNVSGFVETGWTLDTVPPETALTAGPEGATTATGATFGYSGDALGGTPLARFECSLDGAPFATCSDAGTTASGLAAAAHEFAVRAVDAAGNADPTPARRTWTVQAPVGVEGGTPPPAGGPATPEGAAPDRVRPVVSRVRLGKRSFRAAGSGPSVGGPRNRGAVLRFTLSEPATVTLAVQRRAGRRWRAVRGRITVTGKAGANRVRLSGRLRRRALRPGRYRLVLAAADPAGNRSGTARVAFRIKR